MTLTYTPQWIPVRLVPLPDGRTNKIPLSPLTLQACNAHDPVHWGSYPAACKAAAAAGSGHTVGFVLTRNDPFFCVDIDGARTDSGWSDLAMRLVSALPGCMVEVSLSGTGLHIWGRYPNPPEHRKKDTARHIELYTADRFIAIGTNQTGTIADRCEAFPSFAAEWFPPVACASTAGHADGPRADWVGPADDSELIRRAFRSHGAGAVFGDRATFADLWDRNVVALSRTYPGDGDSGVDWSSADAALASHLAFWTGCDQARMHHLMMQSGLVREKWAREDYLPRTIAAACGAQREVLRGAPPPAAAAPSAPAEPEPPTAPATEPAHTAAAMTPRLDSAFVTGEQSAEMFKGCVYVTDQHRVLVPGGNLRKPEQFNALFGGKVFTLDNRNEKTTRKAFEAFTEHQALRPPIVDGTAFRPDLPYGTILAQEGRTRANQYWPAEVVRTPGPVDRFTRHLSLLFPNARDRDILVYWLANVAQHPGVKSQWMPLLVGAEGNGKSLFSRCIAYTVGQRYSHWPDAGKLGGQFNGWMFGKLVICIEDLLIGDALEVWEKLKPMITGEALEIEGKGIDQRTDEVCASLIANSNHRTAIRATLNDRRVCHLWCAQMAADEVKRDGLDEAYMSSLYDWLRDEGGYAAVAHYLCTVPIPSTHDLKWFRGRAPRASHHQDAVAAGLGPIEQEIIEAVDREEVGFRGGWISSKALEQLLDRTRRYLSPNRRREALQALGYDWHPALQDGRVDNVVLPDGAKVRLYVRIDHEARSLTKRAEVAAAYSAAQGVRS